MNCKKGRCCRLSIRFKIAKVAVKLMGMKKLFALPQDELLKKVEKMNETRGFRMTSRRGFGYEDRLINGSHCLKIRTGDAPSQCALLFLFGGGYILGPDDGDVKLAERMGAKSGRDIWFPYYPLCTRQSVKCAFDAVYAVYREMLREYAPENIAILGFSSGGALAIGVGLHNNAQPKPLPMPGLLIASSPGCVPMSEAEKQKMSALNKKDFIVDAGFMTTVRNLMEHGEDVPAYMLAGTAGDFSNFPMTHFYYGGDEVLSVEAEYFAEAFEKYGAPCQIHIAPGMCHCWPSFSFYPEGKKAQREIIDLLRDRIERL